MTTADSNTIGRWRRIRRRLYYWLLLLVLAIVSALSLKTGRWTMRGLARLGAMLRPADCQRALANLALAFPDLDTSSRQKIFEKSIHALGENFYDTLATPKLVKQEFMVQEDLAQGEASLVEELKTLSQGGNGVLILTGHIGCWELFGAWVARNMASSGLGKLAVVTGSIHNAPVDRLIQKRREEMGMKILPRDQGAAPLLRHLRQGGIAAVLLDQNTHVENLPVPFFGQEAPTPVAFARIALRFGIPVLPMALSKYGTGHRIKRAPAWIPEGPAQPGSQNLEELLLWCNQKLENFIRRNPNEWVWFHKRWSLPEDSQ